MTKFPIMLYNTKNTKKALVPPIPPPSSYEDAVGWSAIASRQAARIQASSIAMTAPCAMKGRVGWAASPRIACVPSCQRAAT